VNRHDGVLMQILLHAGLHKSGTTTTQAMWSQAMSAPTDEWYPPPIRPELGHFTLIDPVLKITDDSDPVWSSDVISRVQSIVGTARQHGVNRLIFSSENLSNFHPANRDHLLEAFGQMPEKVLFTATRPYLRWCGGWQEKVKHGSHLLPKDVTGDSVRTAEGSFQALIEDFPARHKLVRLVRTEPPEDDLPVALAEVLGIRAPNRSNHTRVLNQSLGTRVELLRRLNAAGLTTRKPRGAVDMRLLDLVSEHWLSVAPADNSADFCLPINLMESARHERDYLLSLKDHRGIEVFDPHQTLSEWTSPVPPDWFTALATKSWTPGLNSRLTNQEIAEILMNQLLDYRQRIDALDSELFRTRESMEHAWSRAESLDEQRKQALALREAAVQSRDDARALLERLQSSRSWRMTAWLRGLRGD